jgi:hypothetical protein
MARCFVIQPFDGGAYDLRYSEVFVPAIAAAGLEAYRVDQDPRVQIPIERIEEEIKLATACLADITTNNPNVWFELGYAIATQKNVILVCSKDRTDKYPFDIQHRTVISYETRSPGDFQKLQAEITRRLNALDTAEAYQSALESAPVTQREGLPPYETAILAHLLGERLTPTSSISPHTIQYVVNKWGYTNAAIALGLDGLTERGFIELIEDEDDRGNPFDAYRLTSKGLAWLRQNRELLVLERKETSSESTPSVDEYDPFADE